MNLITYEVVLVDGDMKKTAYVTVESCLAALAKVRDQHGWKWKVESYKLVAVD